MAKKKSATVEFEELVRQHESRLYGYVFGMHPNRADAEDILQETIFTLWEKFDDFDRQRPFFNWACRFAYLKTLAFREKHYNRLRILSNGAFEIMANLTGSMPIDGKAESLQIKALDHCLGKLSDSERALLNERYGTGKSKNMTLVAEKMKINPGTLYKRLERIRCGLRDCVGSFVNGGPSTSEELSEI